MAQVDFFSLDQTDRVGYLNHRARSGELVWSNNIRDLLCAAGIEDFVLLIGGPKAPVLLERGLVLAYKGRDNWSAASKHKPSWRLVSRHQVIRRIIKVGGQRARVVFSSKLCNMEVCTMTEIRKSLIKEYLL